LARLRKQVADRPAPDLAAARQGLATAQEALGQNQHQLGQLEAQRTQLMTAVQRVDDLVHANDNAQQALNSFQTLTDVVTGNTENHLSLERYVLQSYFREVLAAANIQLARLTNGRYQFELATTSHGPGAKWTGLEVNVYDDNAGKTRSARTLSGGESFMASLALALALCQIIQEQSGGISIDALFVDEGFGSLDQQALTDALRALQELEGHRMIGIISHVTELEEQIPDQLRVSSVNGRSKVSYQHELQA
jgi:exonuclease SbcC